ncbi:Rv1733c family protein [Streptomyces minutiscleroticus]|uniref:Integral membrane protein n=1 Tax=Streptomyces minutiscleroticus TaxID=68238 RepID=A0A918NQ85_9ACTN|nr:hypothetical protein [Streptomyces minutiscleroticus]GGX86815.1 hypothetical protein GCM10010358_46080 [Streptomyces minutiscleroticus]
MPGTRRTTVRLWRWRQNPLRRRSDLAEAWIVLLAWVIAVLGGVISALVVHDLVVRGLDGRRAGCSDVTAVLVADARVGAASTVAGENRAWAPVRWTGADGAVRTGRAKVPADAAAGTRVTVWADSRGELTSRPPSRAEARFQGTMTATLAAAGAGGTVLAAARLARARLDRRRMDAWAREWDRFDTRRGRRTG